jgi:hypothetical protein
MNDTYKIANKNKYAFNSKKMLNLLMCVFLLILMFAGCNGQQIKDLKGRSDSLQIEKDSLEKKLSRLRGENERQADAFGALKTQCTDLGKTNNGLIGKIKISESNNDRLVKESAQLKKEYAQRLEEIGSKLKTANARITQIENAPENLFTEAVKARADGKLQAAAKMLEAIEEQFPSSAVVKSIEEERKRIKAMKEKGMAKLKEEYLVILAKANRGDLMIGAKILENYVKANPDSEFAGEAAQKSKRLKEEAMRPPITILNKTFKRGNPAIVALKIKNTAGKTIKGVRCSFKMQDNFGDQVKEQVVGGGRTRIVIQDFIFADDTVTVSWKIFAVPNATSMDDFSVDEIAFSDGSKWQALKQKNKK